MKKVWISISISIIIMIIALDYYQHNKHKVRAIEESVTELMDMRQRDVPVTKAPLITVEIPDITTEFSEADTQFVYKDSLPDIDSSLKVEKAELSEYHSTVVANATEQSESSPKEPKSYRDRLIKKHGYSPGIDRFLFLESVALKKTWQPCLRA